MGDGADAGAARHLPRVRGGVDVGMAGVYESDGTWWVSGLWIAPVARGTRAVDALVGACESVVQTAGATTGALWVMEDNARGRRAYVRLATPPPGRGRRRAAAGTSC